MPDVTIMTPFYNTPARFLWKCAVTSIEDQSVEAEMILLDDGSTEVATITASEEIAEEYPEVRLYRREHRGIGEARNEILELAHSDLVAVMDSDDEMVRGRLDTQVSYLAQHPECLIVGGDMVHIDENGTLLSRARHSDRVQRDDLSFRKFTMIAHGTAMYRKEAVVEVGGYPDVDRPGEDGTLLRRLAQRNDFEFEILPKFFIRRRVWGGNFGMGHSALLERLNKRRGSW